MPSHDILLARQPILDVHQRVVAYELLFRDGQAPRHDAPCAGVAAAPARAAQVDGDVATSRVLLSAFDHLDIDTVVGKCPAFVNFTRPLLFNPPPFDKKRIVIEVLEDITVDEELIARISYLRRRGYTIALDDFVYTPNLAPLVKLAHIVKLDILHFTAGELRSQVGQLRRFPLRLLAEKVETHEQFNQCKELGFQWFQGYFFAKPEAVHGQRMEANQQTVMRLLSELQQDDTDYEQIRHIVATDPILSLKLIKLVNSAALSRGREIDSLHTAIALLGIERVRSWGCLLALANMGKKSQALTHTALIRAHFCDALGRQVTQTEHAQDFFMAGLLSTLDAYFDQELSVLIENLPLQEHIKAGLLSHRGPIGVVLGGCMQYERGEWNEQLWQEFAAIGISREHCEQAYSHALEWVSIAEELIGT